MTDLKTKTPIELLRLHADVISELERREIVRTKNNPIGDYTKWLVCKCFDLRLERNSKAGFDATDSNGLRYQIKGRRSEESSVQFSAIRNLEDRLFDFVILLSVLLPIESTSTLIFYV